MNELTSIFPLNPLSEDAFNALLPLFILSVTAVLALIVGASPKGRLPSFLVSMFGVTASLTITLMGLYADEVNLLHGTLLLNPLSKILSSVAHISAIMGMLITYGYDKKEDILSEIYPLIVFSLCGMILMMSTVNLPFMFISLEIMSLSIYVMVAMNRKSKLAAEAGLKYFILGGVAGAFILYGAALLFGASGSFNLHDISQPLTHGYSPLFFVGTLFVLIGLLFKVGAFPFQAWLPDVYQGATTSVTGFMAAAVKLTAFVAMVRVCQFLVFTPQIVEMEFFKTLLMIVAGLTMIYGNFVALAQTDMKRMLAYSTIAHTGYLIVGILALQNNIAETNSILIYLIFYAFTVLGTFAIVLMLEKEKDLKIESLNGLGEKHPMLALSLSLFMLAMAGVPMTSGFIGKYLLFSSAVSAQYVGLVVLAVMTSVVSVYYYLKVIINMFMKERVTTVGSTEGQPIMYIGCVAVVTVGVVVTLQMGIFPQMFLDFFKGLF